MIVMYDLMFCGYVYNFNSYIFLNSNYCKYYTTSFLKLQVLFYKNFRKFIECFV